MQGIGMLMKWYRNVTSGYLNVEISSAMLLRSLKQGHFEYDLSFCFKKYAICCNWGVSDHLYHKVQNLVFDWLGECVEGLYYNNTKARRKLLLIPFETAKA